MSIVIKAKFQDSLRRWSLPRQDLSWSKLSDWVSQSSVGKYEVSYEDSDGERITIANDNDVREFLQHFDEVGAKVFRVAITPLADDQEQKNDDPEVDDTTKHSLNDQSEPCSKDDAPLEQRKFTGPQSQDSFCRKQACPKSFCSPGHNLKDLVKHFHNMHPLKVIHSIPVDVGCKLAHHIRQRLSKPATEQKSAKVLPIGATVRITGLRKAKSQKYNGRTARITMYDPKSIRYTVAVNGLYDSRSGKHKLLALKERNLSVIEAQKPRTQSCVEAKNLPVASPVEHLDSASMSESETSDVQHHPENQPDETAADIHEPMARESKHAHDLPGSDSGDAGAVSDSQPDPSLCVSAESKEDELCARTKTCQTNDEQAPDESGSNKNHAAKIESMEEEIKRIRDQLAESTRAFHEKEKEFELQRQAMSAQYEQDRIKAEAAIKALADKISTAIQNETELREAKAKAKAELESDPIEIQYRKLRELGFVGTKDQLSQVLGTPTYQRSE